MGQSDLRMIASCNLPNRFFDALVGAKVSSTRLALAAENKESLTILAAYIAMLTQQCLASHDFDSWRPNSEYLQPAVDTGTPLRLMHGLLRAGVTTVMLERILEDQSTFTVIADVVDRFAPRPLRLNFDASRVEMSPVRTIGPVPAVNGSSHVRGVPCEVRCMAYDEGMRFLSQLARSGRVSGDTLEEFRTAEVPWLHSGRLVFRVIPSAYFVPTYDGSNSAPFYRAIRAIGEAYPRSKIERVPPSLALAFVRELEKKGTLEKLHGSIEWVQVLHKPLIGRMGSLSAVKCLLGHERVLSRLTLEDAPVPNSHFDAKGAFAILAAE